MLIQPTVHDLDVMGTNLMSSRRRHQVIQTAVQTMTGHLQDSPLGERLAGLPPGLPGLVKRPKSPIESPPDFRALARARWPLRETQMAAHP